MTRSRKHAIPCMTSTGYKINLTLDPLYKGELWVNGYLVSGCRITSGVSTTRVVTGLLMTGQRSLYCLIFKKQEWVYVVTQSALGCPTGIKSQRHCLWAEKSHGKTSPATQDTAYFFLLPTQEKGCYAHFSPKLPMANITELMVKGLHPTDYSLPIQQPLSNPLIEL